jgi:hypothetical protein
MTYETLQKSRSEPVVAEKGWSWPGFWFSWIWALVKHQWGLAGLCWVWMIMILAVGKGLGATAASWSGIAVGILMLLIPALLVGAFGNQWRLESLYEAGYRVAPGEPGNGASLADSAPGIVVKQ